MKRALKIIGIVVAVILLVVIALPFLVNVNSFRPRLESELSAALGRQVKVGNLSLSVLSGSVAGKISRSRTIRTSAKIPSSARKR